MRTKRETRFKTLSGQLFSGVVYLVLISIGISGILVGLFYWHAFQNQVKESQNLREEATTTELNSWIADTIESLKNFALLLGYQDLGDFDSLTLCKALLRENSSYQSISMYNMQRKPFFSENQLSDSNEIVLIDSLGFSVATQGKETHIGKVLNRWNPDSMSVCVTIPVINKNSEVIGCLSSVINLKYMQYNVSMIPFDRFGYAYIIDEQSKIVASNFAEKYQKSNAKGNLPDYFNLMNRKNVMRVYRGYDNQFVIGNYKAIETLQWFFILEYPISAIFSKIGYNLMLMLIALMFSILIGIWSAKHLYMRIAAPLSELSSAARSITKGNFDVRIKTFATHELGEVASAFNTMNTRLNGLFTNLEMRLKYERLVAEVSFMFVHHGNNDFNDLIGKTIERIGHFTGSDRVLFFFREFDSNKYTCTGQWASSNSMADLPQRFIHFSDEDYPWMFYQLQNGFPFVLDSDLLNHTVSDLLPEQNNTLSWMNTTISETSEFSNISEQQLKYQITLPFLEKSNLFGFMTIVYLNEQPNITDEEINLYTTLSNVIGNAVLKTFNQHLLDEERERLRITLLSIGDCVLATSADGIIQIINPMAAELMGCEMAEAVGKPLKNIFKLIHTETRASLDNPVSMAYAQGKTISFTKDVTLVSNLSGECSIELSASPIKTSEDEVVGIVLVFRDISQKLASEIEQMRLQKLEAVSFLSAGLVHDFNNLLSSVMACLSLAGEILPEGSEASELLLNAENTIFQGKDITNQLLSFAKGTEVSTGSSNLNTLLESTVRFILRGSRIKVNFSIEANLPIVHIAAGVMNQIITNLVINSMQAMNAYGSMSVSACIREIDSSADLAVVSGKYIIIRISDNGKGISQENLKNIFKPYFTTKAEGTGLGLPTVLTVLQKHNGEITVDSELGVGTTVSVYLPVTINKQTSEQTPTQTTSNPAIHLLIVEDDLVLRNLMVQTITNLSFSVSSTDTFDDVISILNEAEATALPITIMLMDLSILGNADVNATMQSLKSSYKNLKLIACSGYVKQEEIEKYHLMGFDDILPKPFHLDELQSLIIKNSSL